MDWLRRRRAAGKILLLAVLPAMAFLMAVSVGRYPAGIAQLPEIGRATCRERV